jgi:hypothetical protein
MRLTLKERPIFWIRPFLAARKSNISGLNRRQSRRRHRVTTGIQTRAAECAVRVSNFFFLRERSIESCRSGVVVLLDVYQMCGVRVALVGGEAMKTATLDRWQRSKTMK